MKLDRTKYFIRGNEKYPELIRQFFKGYEDNNFHFDNRNFCYFINYENNVFGCNSGSNKYKHLTELKLTDLAIKNDLGEEYAPKMKEFFEKLGCDVTKTAFSSISSYYAIDDNFNSPSVNFESEKVYILLSDWLGVDKESEIDNSIFLKTNKFPKKEVEEQINKGVESDIFENYKSVVKLRLQDFEKVYKNNDGFRLDCDYVEIVHLIDKSTDIPIISFKPSEFRSIEYLKQ